MSFISKTHQVGRGASWDRELLKEGGDDGALGAAGEGAAVGCSGLGHGGPAGRAFWMDLPSGYSHGYILPLYACLRRAGRGKLVQKQHGSL